jgi:hypothetical protein
MIATMLSVNERAGALLSEIDGEPIILVDCRRWPVKSPVSVT